MAKEITAKIRIEGNCDERGSAEYNIALGERRAKVAQQYLSAMGVNPDRLSIISYGKKNRPFREMMKQLGVKTAEMSLRL